MLVVCMYMHHVDVWCPQKSEERLRSPETRVTDGFELLLGAGNATQVICKNSQCSKLTKRFSSPNGEFLSLVRMCSGLEMSCSCSVCGTSVPSLTILLGPQAASCVLPQSQRHSGSDQTCLLRLRRGIGHMITSAQEPWSRPTT